MQSRKCWTKFRFINTLSVWREIDAENRMQQCCEAIVPMFLVRNDIIVEPESARNQV